VFRGQLDSLRSAEPDAQVSFEVEVEVGDRDQAIVTLTVQPKNRKRYSVINVRHGRVVHIQDVRSRRQAELLAGISSPG
jgi:hypothetical protein